MTESTPNSGGVGGGSESPVKAGANYPTAGRTLRDEITHQERKDRRKADRREHGRITPHAAEWIFRGAMLFLLAAILAVLLVINSHLPAETNVKVCSPECEEAPVDG